MDGAYNRPTLAMDKGMTLRRGLRGLYLITPDEPDCDLLLARVQAVLPAKPALLQYRNKRADAATHRTQAIALQAMCRQADVPLVINDDWRLALDIGAAGAHLGEDDGDLVDARRAGPNLLLGASCYDEFERARRARDAGADYVAFGAFFPTASKATSRRADVSLLQDAVALGVMRVAIGGVRADNAKPLIAAGADLLAVIGAVFDATDPLAAARTFQTLFET